MITPKVIYKDGLQPHGWARWFNAQVHKKNSSNLVSVVGRTGSGKTYSAISICEIMSKMDGIPFTIEHLVFSLKELMELINSGKLVRGSKVIFDEPQCSIGAREFQSEANRVFNFLLSTFRHRNLSLFFCTPFETLLDKSTRKLFHVKIETDRINLKDNTCKLIPLYLEHVDFREEPYKKKLIVVYPDKEHAKIRSMRVDSWSVPKPSEKLVQQYETKKLEFTTNLNKNIQERLNKYEGSGKSITAQQKPIELVPIPLTTREKIIECFKKGMKKQTDIALEIGTTPDNVCSHIKRMKIEQNLLRIENMDKNDTKTEESAYLV